MFSLAGIVLLGAVTVAWAPGCSGGRWPVQSVLPAQKLVAAYLARQTRTAKSSLVQTLRSPPQDVIFGGSRALRFNPAYIHRRTGHTGFNGAVTQGRPADVWALLNLLHERFPAARFRFLWVLDVDKLDARPVDAAILLNPALSRFFPPALVRQELPRALALAEGRQQRVQIGLPHQRRLRYAPDGSVVSGFFGRAKPPPDGHPRAVAANIRKELKIYAITPARFSPRSVRYFEKDLWLMDQLSAAPPVIVAAPFDARIYAATAHHGWGERHRQLLALLARLRKSSTFSFLDLSRSADFGFVAGEFYDGIHLTPQGARRVVDLVLERFPGGL